MGLFMGGAAETIPLGGFSGFVFNPTPTAIPIIFLHSVTPLNRSVIYLVVRVTHAGKECQVFIIYASA